MTTGTSDTQEPREDSTRVWVEKQDKRLQQVEGDVGEIKTKFSAIEVSVNNIKIDVHELCTKLEKFLIHQEKRQFTIMDHIIKGLLVTLIGAVAYIFTHDM